MYHKILLFTVVEEAAVPLVSDSGVNQQVDSVGQSKINLLIEVMPML